MMNKSLRSFGRESSRKTVYGFQRGGAAEDAKKRAAVAGGFEVDNREASNRVTGATRCPKRTIQVINQKA
jgi:hypothetical protein